MPHFFWFGGFSQYSADRSTCACLVSLKGWREGTYWISTMFCNSDDYISVMLQVFFVVLTKWVLITRSSLLKLLFSKALIHFVDFAFTPYNHHVLQSDRQVVKGRRGLRWRGATSLADGLERCSKKIRGEMPHLNNPKSVWICHAYPLESTKNYLLYCSIFHAHWIFFFLLKMTIKTIKIVAHIQTLWAAGFVPHRQIVRATAYRIAREMGI